MKNIYINERYLLYVIAQEKERTIKLEGFNEAMEKYTEKFGIDRSEFARFDYLEGQQEELILIKEKYTKIEKYKIRTYYLSNGEEISDELFDNVVVEK